MTSSSGQPDPAVLPLDFCRRALAEDCLPDQEVFAVNALLDAGQTERAFLAVQERKSCWLKDDKVTRWQGDKVTEGVSLSPCRLATLPPCHLPEVELIQAALPAGWALLDFWVRDERQLEVFVLTREHFWTRSLTNPWCSAAFRNHQASWLSATTADPPPVQPNDEVLDDLDHYLFAPLRPLLRDVQGLYLVPHDYLHTLPLHASRRSGVRSREVVYLGDDFAVAYLPSAALLPRLPPLQAPDRLLSLANPEEGTRETLPFSDWEARQLQERLQLPAHWFHVGPSATFGQAASWQSASLLHFSGHGAGERSAPVAHLHLADGLLLAQDVLERLPRLVEGALVLLNGCETGVRHGRALDQGIGLTSAFLLRGAGLVLASQWPVNDACAAEMTLTFVEEIFQRGTEPTEALRRAQRQVRLLTDEQIEERLRQLQQRFPAKQYPHETVKLHRHALRLCRRQGRLREAREHAEQAAAILGRLGEADLAECVLQAARRPASRIGTPADTPFRHPLFWSAFYLIGRVPG